MSPHVSPYLPIYQAVNLCRAKGVKLMTALQRRFDPNFSRVKRSIAEVQW